MQLRPQTAISHHILTTVLLNFLSQILRHAEFKTTESQPLKILLTHSHIKPFLILAHPHNRLLKSRIPVVSLY